ncbi:hypothetical protein IST455A_01721 [Burkholderia multivorans]|nr:hypothetical protein [Burkholderia multivorans]MDN7609884.1 hypothetical protein [Burkholderia multivorans]CAB5279583.1 hypothetical protein IST424_01833 [Burkholderia multivorans]CAB5285759.1 hypothetical protein IST461_00662 [Burkholderia multivorans]CAB5287741.1 hypothetical protein IST419_01834 [Burkholderia multivorans]CAB5288736.1 hypothetical protein IST455A_01721 [Burkholderia multivorans]
MPETMHLLVDTRVLQAQIDLLKASIETLGEGSELETFRQQLRGYLDRMRLDVVHGDRVTTRGADGTLEVRYVLRFGVDFERVLAALRAGKFDD